MKKQVLFLFLCLLTSFTTMAQLRFARLFSDHAVLQRQKPIPVWGWTNPNEPLIISLNGSLTQVLQTSADSTGKWQVQFSALEAGGPYILSAKTGSGQQVECKNVMIGDVWLCSGQSNMEWTVAQANDYTRERKNADFPQIRHFLVEHDVNLAPIADLNAGNWEICSPATVGRFTAVGFFFAREVLQQTNIPVGILHSSWGGSQVESWISKEAMLASEVLRPYGENFPKTWEEADLRLERSIKKKLLGNPDANPTPEDEKRYVQPEYDWSGWLSADPMWQWDWKGVWAWRGNGYMGKTVDIPGEMTSQVTTLGLADNYNYNEIYINGKLVASGLFRGTR